MGEWPKQRVDQLQGEGILFVEDGNHGEYRPRQSEFQAHGTAFIRAADMNAGQILFESAQRINDVALKRIRKGFGRGGDVLFSHKGTVGKLALAPGDAPPFVCSPQTTFWRVMNEEHLDRCFLYYYMQSEEFTNQWNARKAETDMADYVSLTSQRELTVALPDIVVQRSIGKVLGALDNKIELNRRMNRTLEHMAAALFKSWFVDFDPVVAKAAGRKPCGMDDATVPLFPDGFEESELGPIPKGWRPSQVGSEFELTMGQSPPGSTYNEEGVGIPFFQGRTDFGDRFPAERVYCSAPTRLARKGDTLVSVRAPVGDVNMALRDCAVGRGVSAARHRTGATAYTYQTFKSLEPEFSAFEAEGTVFGSIGGEGFRSIKIIGPAEKCIEAYEFLTANWDSLIEKNHVEAKNLAELRDRLLPQLLSGEIRLTDAEEQVDRVL